MRAPNATSSVMDPAWPASLRRPAPPATLATANLKLTFHLDHSAGADH